MRKPAAAPKAATQRATKAKAKAKVPVGVRRRHVTKKAASSSSGGAPPPPPPHSDTSDVKLLAPFQLVRQTPASNRPGEAYILQAKGPGVGKRLPACIVTLLDRRLMHSPTLARDLKNEKALRSQRLRSNPNSKVVGTLTETIKRTDGNAHAHGIRS